jgi:hypothetical protein
MAKKVAFQRIAVQLFSKISTPIEPSNTLQMKQWHHWREIVEPTDNLGGDRNASIYTSPIVLTELANPSPLIQISDMYSHGYELHELFAIKTERYQATSAVGERGCDENFVARRGVRG